MLLPGMIMAADLKKEPQLSAKEAAGPETKVAHTGNDTKPDATRLTDD